jgi:hypothetical protein
MAFRLLTITSMTNNQQIIETWVALTVQLTQSPKAQTYERANGILKLWGASRLLDDIRDMQKAIEKLGE